MSLAAWQRAVVGLVAGQDGGQGPDRAGVAGDLTDAERSWLAGADGPGLELTRVVLRSWRAYRIGQCAPLTMALLGRDLGERVVTDYLASTTSPSSFRYQEGLQFLAAVDACRLGVAHIGPVVALDRALLTVRHVEAVDTGGCGSPDVLASRMVGRHPAAAVVTFTVEPALLLRALLGGKPVPEPGRGSGHVLCAPRLPRGMRSADEREVAILESLRVPRPLAALTADEDATEALRALAAAGAVVDASPTRCEV